MHTSAIRGGAMREPLNRSSAEKPETNKKTWRFFYRYKAMKKK